MVAMPAHKNHSDNHWFRWLPFYHALPHHLLSQVEMELVTWKTGLQERGTKNNQFVTKMDVMSAEIKTLIADVKTAR